MSRLIFLQGKILSPLSRRVGALVFNSKITEVAQISTSAALHMKDIDIKNDPDVKNILREMNKDFDDKKKSEKNSEQPTYEKETIMNEENQNEENADGKKVAAGNNISQLLSELYGEEEEEKKDAYSSVGGYKEYVDRDSGVIYDVDEEREIMRKAYLEGKTVQTDKKTKPSQAEKYKHLAHKRGERGVFEVAELAALLKAEKIGDLAVIEIPPSRQYADFMLVGTAKSTRHLRTVSSLIVSLYKQKRLPTDPIPKKEGELDTNTGWTALDMGNIVLHLLVQEQREYYDLEMLWTVGPDFDDNTRKMDTAEKRIETLEDLMATELDMEDLLGEKVEG